MKRPGHYEVADFVRDHCHRSDTARTTTAEMLTAYRKQAAARALEPYNAPAVLAQVRMHYGVIRRTPSGSVVVIGLALT